jgi:hypothetical protein
MCFLPSDIVFVMLSIPWSSYFFLSFFSFLFFEQSSMAAHDGDASKKGPCTDFEGRILALIKAAYELDNPFAGPLKHVPEPAV